MRIPRIEGLIERRILVNFRVAPEILAGVLPAPFRPKVVHGSGMAGICLIRLAQVRPHLVPRALGVASENAAHRIAVEWEEGGETREGVYIHRRDTSSRLNALLGGRLFPGVTHRARFEVREEGDEYSVHLESGDGEVAVKVDARSVRDLPPGSLFPSLAEASRFFEGGSLGYSPTRTPGEFDGLQLRCLDWAMEPLEVTQARSSFFEDERRFPRGSVTFDCALLMRSIRHEWHGKGIIKNEDCPTAGV